MNFYAGYDAAVFPGVDSMAWLKRHSNLRWCGYYLAPAPNLAPAAASWRGRRAAIAADWGLAPLYVGQQMPAQAAPDQPAPLFSSILTAAQGRLDGAAAVALARRDGFPAGSYIYIDWEDGGALTAAAQDYLAAWLSTVDGRGFGPAIYCSHLLGSHAGEMLAGLGLRHPGRIWCYKVGSTALHPLAVPLTALPQPDPAAAALRAPCCGNGNRMPGSSAPTRASASWPISAVPHWPTRARRPRPRAAKVGRADQRAAG